MPNKLNDQYSGEVKKLMRKLRNELRKNGFKLFSGIDDVKLKNKVKKGYVYQQARNEVTGDLDGSIECVLPELGRKGLTNFERFVTVEMPCGLSDKRSAEAIRIINNVFLIPLYRLYGVI